LSERRWSLARRLTRIFVAATTLFVLAVASVSTWYLHRTVARELDVSAENCLKDLRFRFEQLKKSDDSLSTPDKAVAAAAEQVLRLSPYPVAVRTWDATWGWKDVDGGDTRLLTADRPARDRRDETIRGPDGLRWRTEALGDGYYVGIVLDGSSQIAILRRYEVFAGFLLAGSVLAGILLGSFYLRRVSHTLRHVAQSVRRVREPAETVEIDVRGAPDEIRDVVEALHQLLRNIQSASEQSRVLYASMAHELRAPIQNLVGATEVALLARREADAYRRVLESNLDELRELGDAVDNLMTICAPRGADSGRPESEEFDVESEARMRLERERTRAERLGVQLELRSRGDTHLEGDREGVLRALRNLAANAIDWSERGGRVEVAIEGSDSTVAITVDDSGPGVAPELRERIFDPFYRGPAARGRRAGYGLGLAIVRAAADRQGGSIAVDTSPAGGARFRLVLPKRRRELASQRV
jgi:signal transduction histidine kinase